MILLLIVALVNIIKVNSLQISQVRNPCRSFNTGRLFAGKDKDADEPAVKTGPGGKDVIRGILWATTPWIFNSYEVTNFFREMNSNEFSSKDCSSKRCISYATFFEQQDTKNYVDGKKTVKVTVPEAKKRGNSRNDEVFSTTGTYNMADPSRAPVMSGSVSDYKTNKASPKLKGEVIEAPKVNFFSSLTGSFTQAARAGAGAEVLGDSSKWSRPKKTLILYEYEGSAYWYVLSEKH